MNFKIGDKLVCKENDKFIVGKSILTAGNSYEFVEIKHDRIGISYLIRIEGTDWHFCESNIEKYFYNKKEIREKKLKKLNDVLNS